MADTEAKFVTQVDDRSDGPSSDEMDKTGAQSLAVIQSRAEIIMVYGFLYIIFIVGSLQLGVTQSLSIYVTSSFNQAPMITTTIVLSEIMIGVVRLPLAKIMDYWGRSMGFLIIVFAATLGFVLTAVCQNVETFAAAQVFYWIGASGLVYVLNVFIADTVSLAWRGLIFSWTQTPVVVSTFAGPAAAQSFLKTSGWRWGYGCFAIVLPSVCLPFLIWLYFSERRANLSSEVKHGKDKAEWSWQRWIRHFIMEWDIIGMFLLMAGWVLILLPLTLASSQKSSWRSATVIAMLVVGFVTLIAFCLYERFLATKSFLPFTLLIDRTVLGSCFLTGVLSISLTCWQAYFSPYLQLTFNQSVEAAGYIASIYELLAIYWGIVVGGLVRWTGRFKWLALAAIPLQILGTGLMIYFRQPGHGGVGTLVMCQIFVAIAGGTLSLCGQLAIMAAVGPEHVAAALALIALFDAVGSAVGASISGAIWTNSLLPELVRILPTDAKHEAYDIYASLYYAKRFANGTPVRMAINEAYAYAQRYMCIAATAVLPLCFILVIIWKDFKVKEVDNLRAAKIAARIAAREHAVHARQSES